MSSMSSSLVTEGGQQAQEEQRPSITVFVGTANLGNAEPDQASLSAWIPKDGLSSIILPASQERSHQEDVRFSLIVLGFQEATFDTHLPETSDTILLHNMLQRQLPSYSHSVKYQRGEMRLEIFSTCPTKVLHVAAQNTGLAGRPNKGGILAELLVFNNLRLSFATCHLEAHEGAAKYKIRCTTMTDIFQNTKPTGELHDFSLTSHYSFVLGDLNFRTELPGSKYANEDEHKQLVRDLVHDKQWAELNEYDELRRALANKDCLVGYETLPCHFSPTFKVERQAGYHYVDKRRPSYTDRILYKANHDSNGRIRPLLYEPIDDFTSSDHKPVRGVYEIQLNDKILLRPRLLKQRQSMRQLRRFSAVPSSSQSAAPSTASTRHSKLVVSVSRMRVQLNKNATIWQKISRRSSSHDTKVLGNDEKDVTVMNGTNHGRKSFASPYTTPAMVNVASTASSIHSVSAAALANTLPNIAPSPYIMFVASPRDCIIRRENAFWRQFLRCLLCFGRRHHSVREVDGTKTRISMGWPRTSIQKHTREADWKTESVKIEVHSHTPHGQAIPLTGSILHMTVMDGESIGNNQGNPLLGTFSFNLANLLFRCMQGSSQATVGGEKEKAMPRPSLVKPSEGDNESKMFQSSQMTTSSRAFSSLSFRSKYKASRRGSVLGFLGLGGTDPDQQVLVADIDEPLLRNGKEVGQIQCRIEAYWVSSDSGVLLVDSEKQVNGAEVMGT